VPRWGRWVANVAGVLISVLLWVIAVQYPVEPVENTPLKVLSMFWALAPPAWFFVDWWFYKGLTMDQSLSTSS
jgi:hypothetical protein